MPTLVERSEMERRLRWVEGRYESLGYFSHSFWREHSKKIDLENFRCESAYLSQAYGTEKEYWATLGYAAAVGEKYLNIFTEDTLFGVVSFQIGGRTVTRDLLDSVLEISFLERKLGSEFLSSVKVLDIGAGYGRFAHRFTSAFPNSCVYCADAVPISSLVCDSYIKFRCFQNRARVAWLWEVKETYEAADLAVNIHSWSECTLESVNFWLDLLVAKSCPYLFLVPHEAQCLTKECSGPDASFLSAIQEHGYELLASEPKYRSDVMQMAGIYPTQYMLFKRGEN